MKKKLPAFLILFFVFTVFQKTFAQHMEPAVLVGNVAELKKEFYENLKASGQNERRSSDFSFKVSDSKVISLNLTAKKESLVETIYFGETVDEQSLFHLSFSEKAVKGSLILPSKKLAYQFFSDASNQVFAKEVDINKVVCHEYTPDELPKSKSGLRTSEISQTVPKLQSLPSASSVVLLDFDGHFVEGSFWNNGLPINASASVHSTDQINKIWEAVSESYRPFNLNITTDESVYLKAPSDRRMRVVFTPTNYFYPNVGGVAYIGSFTWGNETPCWVFNSATKASLEAATHEIGHTLNLIHDGKGSEEYYRGHGKWAPVMGFPGDAMTVVQWSKGEYSNASNKEDDLSIIAGQINGFGYRSDDHGNSSNLATAIKIESTGKVLSTNNKGIVGRNNDIDVFSFTSKGGNVTLSIASSSVTSLDISATIRDAANNVVASSNGDGATAAFNLNLKAGTYYLYIDGVGSGDPLTNGYSDYGSIGSYHISGQVATTVANNAPKISFTSPVANSSYSAPATISMTVSASDADGKIVKVEYYRGNTLIGTSTTSPFSFNWTNVSSGSYSITAKAFDNLNAATVSSPVTVNVGNVNNLSNIYEAEKAVLSGVQIQKQHAGFTGTGYGDYQNNSNDFIEWTVNVSKQDNYKLTFRYASSSSRNMAIRINNVIVESAKSFTSTGDFNTWKTIFINATLKAGENKIKVSATGSSGPNMDHLVIDPISAPIASSKILEAELAELKGPAKLSLHTGFTGTGYADFVNASNEYIEWTANTEAGNYNLVFRYASSSSRPLEIRVNGTVIKASESFVSTSDFSVWKTHSITAALKAGDNKIRVSAIGSSGPNIDHLQLVKASGVIQAVVQHETTSLSVFPNPIQQELNVELPHLYSGNLTVVAFDAMGQVKFKYSNQVESKNVINFKIPIEKFTPGVYFLRVTTDFEEKLIRVIKE